MAGTVTSNGRQLSIQEQLELLLNRSCGCISKTRFISLVLQPSMLAGIPLGQGKCKAVILSANHFQVYAETVQGSTADLKFYYGDSKQQSKEYLINANVTATGTNNVSSDIIFCTDLSEVWVRFSDINDDTPIQIEVQIYYEGEDNFIPYSGN